MNLREVLEQQGLSEGVYLGDSVYAATDGFHIILFLNNGGAEMKNRIALDPHVITNLEHYHKKLCDMRMERHSRQLEEQDEGDD